MPAIRTGPPSAEPWTLAEVKNHLRVDHTDEDAVIGALLASARTAAENKLGRTLCTTPWRLTLDAFPSAIKLPMPRALAVQSVKYLDSDGVQRTLNPADYLLDDVSEPGYLVPAYGKAWPATQCRVNAVVVEYTAGYGPNAEDVPADVRHWVLLQIGTTYANRQTINVGNLVTDFEFADRLLDYEKIWVI